MVVDVLVSNDGSSHTMNISRSDDRVKIGEAGRIEDVAQVLAVKGSAGPLY